MLKKFPFIPILFGLVIVLGIFGLAAELRAQENPLIKEGDPFPGVVLKTPDEVKDRAYLEISGKENFAIKEIKAKVILVEIMNVYCASCQNLAPIYNKLFARIQSNPDTRKGIKMIGVAAGNNEQ
jgi:thiol-disulfide isomerase/thioredoxin